MNRTLLNRLKRLELAARGRIHSANVNVFGDVERAAAALEFYELAGRWPATLTAEEACKLSSNLALIEAARLAKDRADSAGT